MRPKPDPRITAFPTPAEMEHYMQVGRSLRAEAIRNGFASIAARFGRIRRAALPRPAGERDPETAHAIRSPLAAIRSSAEILRDNPEMPPAQRARFIDIVLAEEQRLERLVAGAFVGGGVPSR